MGSPFQSFRTTKKYVYLLSSRLYCRYRNLTGSCANALADFTAGGELLSQLPLRSIRGRNASEAHPALKIVYSLVVLNIRLSLQRVKPSVKIFTSQSQYQLQQASARAAPDIAHPPSRRPAPALPGAPSARVQGSVEPAWPVNVRQRKRTINNVSLNMTGASCIVK